ncbi:hypothetical protein GCM10020295_45220 [Streptomyces cinereospinus]
MTALPLVTAGHPYNAEALIHGLSPEPAPHPQDAPWHQVRLLLRLHRYAREVLHGEAPADIRLLGAGQALNRHRDASEAAAAAARRPARPASHRRPRTRSGCSTPTSGTRWRRPGSRSSSRGRNTRWGRSEHARGR